GSPPRIASAKRPGVTREGEPAKRGKARRISARHRQRVAYTDSSAPVHSVAEYRRKGRFERTRSVTVERHIGDAKIFGQLELSLLRCEPAFAPIEFEPAGAAEISLCAGLGARRFGRCDRDDRWRSSHSGG